MILLASVCVACGCVVLKLFHFWSSKDADHKHSTCTKCGREEHEIMPKTDTKLRDEDGNFIFTEFFKCLYCNAQRLGRLISIVRKGKKVSVTSECGTCNQTQTVDYEN